MRLPEGRDHKIPAFSLDHPIDNHAGTRCNTLSSSRMGLEGIIAKLRDSPYRSDRTGDWIKIKCA